MNNNLAVLIALILSLALVIIGLKVMFQIIILKNRGIEVSGKITSLKKNIGINATTIQPVVTFITRNGISISNSSDLTFIPGYYKVGKNVKIIYDEKKPDIFIIDDVIAYMIPLLMIVLGLTIDFFIFT